MITVGSSAPVKGRRANATATKRGPSGSRTAMATRHGRRRSRRRSRGAWRAATGSMGIGCPVVCAGAAYAGERPVRRTGSDECAGRAEGGAGTGPGKPGCGDVGRAG